MDKQAPTWKQPSHPDKIEVITGDKPYSTYARSKISLPSGALFTKITDFAPIDHDTYTTVATSKDSRVELRSDLVYSNHSCDPIRVARDRPLAVGDTLTFFYPSTEWKMAQPFQCECGAGVGRCLGFIAGADSMDPEVLGRYWLNEHVKEQVAEKRGLHPGRVRK
ncbi:hypothetical protein BDV25DRAFT_132359 [Aspergillus avenaceus]|uniref:Galactose-proton symport n=1 Tax=Aspergillus avenaceus TaxID=36643 RepID=A0A5N6TLB6_ASPAV|nr:hypothetical protein BDV25DRAFT_132359 [Aspergillus avenaceus]